MEDVKSVRSKAAIVLTYLESLDVIRTLEDDPYVDTDKEIARSPITELQRDVVEFLSMVVSYDAISKQHNE